MRLLSLLMIFVCIGAARAQPSPVGYWQTKNGGGVVQVSRCGDALCARLAGIVMDSPGDPMPTDWRGVSQCGLTLVNGARQVGVNLWRGKILDPRDGRVYGVELHVDNRGRLAVRGFLGVALLGRTDYWTRYRAVPPPDCRMTPAQARNEGG